MLSYGKSRDENYPNDGEIYAFYILQEYQNLGIGKKLFLA
jgi:ribosomal protein S18 acetylase RimI-like enzyme